jgi:hypothetical protein
MIQRLTDVLLAIDEAQRPQEVGLFPGWRLHQLKATWWLLERQRER